MQTFTRLELNQPVSNTELPDTSFVRGLSSGATGYAIPKVVRVFMLN